MDQRHETFRRRFAKAAGILNAKPHEIASMKFRSTAPAVSYSEFYDLLRRSHSVTLSPVKTDEYERGMLVTLGDGRAIVVEHETGLEILYAAGAIASLIALIPLLGWCWRRVSDFRHRHYPDEERIEIRRLDDKGVVLEDVDAVDLIWLLACACYGSTERRPEKHQGTPHSP